MIETIGFSFKGDQKHHDNIKVKTKSFPLWPENKINPQDKFGDHMKKMKPNIYTHNKKFLCDRTDKKIYLMHWGILKFHIRQGVMVDEVHDVISFEQIKCLGKNML